MSKHQPVYVIDALNYIFRAYYGIPGNVVGRSGMPTHAVLGYLRTLLRIIRERKPSYMAAAFEGSRSFRTSVYTEYKANRKQMPEDLAPQIDWCRKVTEAIGVACVEADDYEADDVIGTIAVRMSAYGHPAVVVTGDKDMSQLVRDGIRVYDMAKEVWLDEAGVRVKLGVAPGQIPDLLALHGDSVDNIPGVTGVGEKIARQILSVCGSVEDIVESPDLLAKVRFRGQTTIVQRIQENMDKVRISRRLATICCDVPINVTPERVRYRRGDSRTLKKLCHQLGLAQVLPDIPVAQPSLFS
jgi:DNA polymerase-1